MKRINFIKFIVVFIVNIIAAPFAVLLGATAPQSIAKRKLSFGPFSRGVNLTNRMISQWEEETKLVTPEIYGKYFRDGKTRGFKSLEALELAFKKVMREVKKIKVARGSPACWNVYNMGYIVKTHKSIFAIDLYHRSASKFIPLLDFALVTHSHGDHFVRKFCEGMNKAGKPVISNFFKSPEFDKIKANAIAAGFPDTFRIKDVGIRAFSVDHSVKKSGLNFTTAFEIRIGKFRLLHTGDCGVSNNKLRVKWGRPDLWLLFPMGSLDVSDAIRRINPKSCVFGHLWELGHAVKGGRAVKSHIERGLKMALSTCKNTTVAFWGDRII